MTDAARLIKRYANRKLYDTELSKYVTLQQIAEMVREGQEVQIIDNGSKQDITRVTLAQIIYEEQKSGNGSAASIKNLRSLIEQSAGKVIGNLQRMADDRVKSLITGAANRVSQLEAEIGRLHRRIEELEARLRTAGGDSEDAE